ncbi:hypothetical protein C2G38_2191366 [Gigaspora rosea]|uniref:Uncharacterized protein n=1 Tax=Gigaspora rosea TaxID=44941 RepID=A0A397V1V6_9GLOM|nr:hypothetical protein C2G38_2191366 [Gigaspora rosea]
MNLEIIEDSSYPSSPMIVYKEKKNNVIQRSFYYEIIEEGVYLNASQSAYTSTSKGRQYKIPDQYAVKTTIGRNKKKTIYCSINYENKQPVFHISYAKKFGNNALELLKSASQNYYSNEDYISVKAIDYSALDKTQVSQEEANIKITQVKLYHLEVEKDSTDAFEQRMIDKIDKIGAQRSIKDLLNYIIPYLEQSNILKCTDPVVHLRISGDG